MGERPPAEPKPNRGWFQKGRRGNPKGRPVGGRAPEASALDIVVRRTLVITLRGVPREITMQEALEHRTYQDAIAGKRMAQREILKWIGKRQARLAKHGEQPRRPALAMVASPDPDNADAALLLLGIAAHNPARQALAQHRAQLLLEPWAVEAALRRRRNRDALAEKDLSEIRRCTRDADTVRLLKGC